MTFKNIYSHCIHLVYIFFYKSEQKKLYSKTKCGDDGVKYQTRNGDITKKEKENNNGGEDPINAAFKIKKSVQICL